MLLQNHYECSKLITTKSQILLRKGSVSANKWPGEKVGTEELPTGGWKMRELYDFLVLCVLMFKVG